MKPHLPPEELSAYAAGELPAEAQSRAAAHLQVCADCCSQYEKLRRAEQALSLLAAAEPAPDLLPDLRRRLAARPSRPRRWRWGAALAVAAGATAALLLWPHPSRPRPMPPALVRASQPPAPHAAGQPEDHPRVLVKAPANEQPTLIADRPLPAPSPRHRPHRHAPPPSPPSAVLVAHAESVPPSTSARPVAALDQAVAPPAPTLETDAASQDAVILILGDPLPVLPSSQCHLEVTLPNGNTSILDREEDRDSTGQLRTARISYQNLTAAPQKPHEGG